MCKAKAIKPTAMQEVGVFDECDQRKAGLDPGCFSIFPRNHRRSTQGRQADPVDARKSVCGLHPCTTRAKAAVGCAAMAVQQHRTIEYAVAPQARHDSAKRKPGIDQTAGSRA